MHPQITIPFPCRLGDTFPNGQVEDIQVKARMYRWTTRTTSEGEELPFTVRDLVLSPATPSLRYSWGVGGEKVGVVGGGRLEGFSQVTQVLCGGWISSQRP